jgi:hypothetical protein
LRPNKRSLGISLELVIERLVLVLEMVEKLSMIISYGKKDSRKECFLYSRKINLLGCVKSYEKCMMEVKCIDLLQVNNILKPELK